ncbi:MAG: carboxypeptidase M32 [Candidatus Nanohaloarchaea archaeon]
MSDESLKKLKDKSKKITNIEEASEILHWDQEVMMPEKGVEARQQQLSVLSGLSHQILVSSELGQILQEVESESLDQGDESTYREIKREHDRSSSVNQELIEEISSKSSQTLDKWKKARKEGNFDIVKEDLEELIELKREYARQIDPDEEPYKVLFKDYEPYIEFENMQKVMEALRDELTDLFDRIKGSDVRPENCFEKEVSKERQLELNKEILSDLGYDWDRGRLDTSEHPFTVGNQHDARITTRFNTNDISKSILPTIHEFGHALYELGLPKEYYGLPAGSSRDLSIHESQSRLWENHVARSRDFWNHFTPKLQEIEAFEDSSEEEFWKSINRVKEENLIRVEADEVTYHLHIYLRYSLERRLVNGEIEVEDLPEKWNDKMEELLGMRPENDVEGVLQDIHWYQGSIGYFTTYSLGSVLSAQIYQAMEEEIESLDEKISEGEFEELKNWLKENIHSKGSLYKTEDLIEQATGEKLNPDYFLEYIESKYGEIYNL